MHCIQSDILHKFLIYRNIFCGHYPLSYRYYFGANDLELSMFSKTDNFSLNASISSRIIFLPCFFFDIFLFFPWISFNISTRHLSNLRPMAFPSSPVSGIFTNTFYSVIFCATWYPSHSILVHVLNSIYSTTNGGNNSLPAVVHAIIDKDIFYSFASYKRWIHIFHDILNSDKIIMNHT